MNTPFPEPLTSIVLAAAAAITLTGCPKSDAPLSTDKEIQTVTYDVNFVTVSLPDVSLGLSGPVTLLDEDGDGTVDSVHRGRNILVKPGFNSRGTNTKNTVYMTPEMERKLNEFFRSYKDMQYDILLTYRDALQAKREDHTAKR